MSSYEIVQTTYQMSQQVLRNIAKKISKSQKPKTSWKMVSFQNYNFAIVRTPGSFPYANLVASIGLKASFQGISQLKIVSHSRPLPKGGNLEGITTAQNQPRSPIMPKNKHQLYHGVKLYGFWYFLPNFASLLVSPLLMWASVKKSLKISDHKHDSSCALCSLNVKKVSQIFQWFFAMLNSAFVSFSKRHLVYKTVMN